MGFKFETVGLKQDLDPLLVLKGLQIFTKPHYGSASWAHDAQGTKPVNMISAWQIEMFRLIINRCTFFLYRSSVNLNKNPRRIARQSGLMSFFDVRFLHAPSSRWALHLNLFPSLFYPSPILCDPNAVRGPSIRSLCWLSKCKSQSQRRKYWTSSSTFKS